MKEKKAQMLPPEEIALFAEQVALILRSGIPLGDGLEMLARSYEKSRYSFRFDALHQFVRESGSLADAAEVVGFFPPYFCAMVRIGERAGKLDEVLDGLTEYYNWEAGVRSAARSALLYPAALSAMLAVVIGILMVLVLPVFSRVYESFGMSPAYVASGVLAFGMWVGRIALALIGLLLLGLGVFAALLKTSRRDRILKTVSARIPALRRTLDVISAGRFANVVGIMLTAGYPIESAMELAPTVISDEAYVARVQKAAASVAEGNAFAAAVAEAGLFDGMYDKLVLFGANAGSLDKVMRQLAVHYREEADTRLAKLVSIVEPALVGVLSAVIGGILLSVTLPLLGILSSIA